MSYGGFDCSMLMQLLESARRDRLFTVSRLWEIQHSISLFFRIVNGIMKLKVIVHKRLFMS